MESLYLTFTDFVYEYEIWCIRRLRMYLKIMYVFFAAIAKYFYEQILEFM